MSSLRDLILVSIAALAVSGCANNTGVYDPHGYLDRRDSIELSAGDANANNIAVQMVDPWPPGVQDTELEVPAERPASQAAGEDAGSDDSGASDDD